MISRLIWPVPSKRSLIFASRPLMALVNFPDAIEGVFRA